MLITFFSFQQTTDITSLEMVNADADRLKRIRLECEGKYIEGKEYLCSQVGLQEPWIKCQFCRQQEVMLKFQTTWLLNWI